MVLEKCPAVVLCATVDEVRLDLLSTFVLTPFLIFTEEDLDFVPEDVE